MYKFEADLLQVLDVHDVFAQKCVNGEIGFWEICDKYNNFYNCYVLGGHDFKDEKHVVLENHQSCIEPHRIISHEILGQVGSDEDAKLEVYNNAGRFDLIEALWRLKQVAFLDKKIYSLESPPISLLSSLLF